MRSWEDFGMQCPRCQHENRPHAKFCEECAAPQARSCSGCGAELSPTAKFCFECAHPVAPTARELRFGSPEAYTPKHLVDRILTSKSALEGERKQVTILFADLKGSMELLADRDPEDARKLLDPVLERMMEAVHRYEGTVNQVMGDGIMALFGAPLAHEDHAVRACYAALRMQDSVKRYAEGVLRSHGVTVRIRVGLNSGEVVVRAIASDLHMDYTAVGQTTHLAARMEQLADPGCILLSPVTLELAEGYVEVKPLGPLPVKGLSEPVEVHELLGASSVRSRLHASAARGLTRFVGRDTELDQLRAALERAGAAHGQVVAVVGEPGVGKSRLYWEFTHSHRTQGWLMLEAGSVSYGKATAYVPVVDLLKVYFQIEGRDDTRKIREKVMGKLLSLDRALEPSLPALLSLLDLPVEDAAWERLDPRQRRQQALDGVKRLLLRESQVQPLLVLFEDLHWIDSETQALLDSLVESLPTARLLLLINYRPEYRHGWGGKTYYRQLRIDPLPAESAADLLAGLLGTDPSLDPLKRLLIERTEGNPLFLEESVRTLLETKTLVGERGAYRLAHDAQAIQVPATVQTILAARIDRVSPEDKRLLQAASVIGKDVPFGLLQAIAELSDDELNRALNRLHTAEFLYEARLFPDLEYTFKHALTHQVAYGSLLQERRRTLHASIVDAMERLYPDRLAEQVDRLASHALGGELWDKALTYFQQAGARNAALAGYREAVTCFERARVALGQLPKSRDTMEAALRLCFDLRTAFNALGEYERVYDHLREAEGLAKSLDDQRLLGRVCSYMTQHFWLIGDQDRAVEVGQQTLAIASALGDLGLQVTINFYLGRAYLALGDYAVAIDLLQRNAAMLEGDRVRERFGVAGLPSVLSRVWLAWGLAEGGKFHEATACAEEGLRIAEAAGHTFSLIGACFGVGLVSLRNGDLGRAVVVLERGLGLCRDWNIPVWFSYAAAHLGYAYAQSGRADDGRAILQQVVEQDRGIRRTVDYSLWVAWLSEAYLLAGRITDAAEFASRALDLAREHNERGHQAWALRILAEVTAHQEPTGTRTAERYRQAMGLADELGMRPLAAHCHLGLGKLYRRTGKRREAQEHLGIATTMYREMEMRFWLEQVEAEMRELG
jgi:class 3 adenylate cyclase/tetratricopeptide (TPR) repeat protein